MRQCRLLPRLLRPFEQRVQAPLLTGFPRIRKFSSSPWRSAGYPKASESLEKRIDAIPLERFRNFCIVAHVVRKVPIPFEYGASTDEFRTMGKAL